ncbi:MAG: hypothetical protein VYA84_06340, partial [Planctomycetota bacterium]|nr:hypothetical protein [Planctomycetota bacterium]
NDIFHGNDRNFEERKARPTEVDCNDEMPEPTEANPGTMLAGKSFEKPTFDRGNEGRHIG